MLTSSPNVQRHLVKSALLDTNALMLKHFGLSIHDDFDGQMSLWFDTGSIKISLVGKDQSGCGLDCEFHYQADVHDTRACAVDALIFTLDS